MTSASADRLVRAIVIASCAAALAAGGVAARHAIGFVDATYPGFFVFGSGFLAPTNLVPHRSEAVAAGLGALDLVIAVEGVPIERGSDVWDAARRAGPGVPLRYTLARPSGARFETVVATRTLSRQDVARLLVRGWSLGLLLLGVTSAGLLARPRLPAARALFVFGGSVGAGLGLLASDHFLGQRLLPWSFGLGALALAGFIHVVSVFPVPRGPYARWPRATLAAAYGALALLYAGYVARYLESPISAYPYDVAAFGGYQLGTALLTLGLAWDALRAPDALARQRSRVMLLAPAFAFAAALLLALLGSSTLRESAAVAFTGTLFALPPVIAFAMLRRNLFELDAFAQRAIAAGLVGAASAGAYLSLLAFAQRNVGGDAPGIASLVSLACFVVVLLAVGPLRRLADDGVRALLFPEQRAATRVLRETTADLARLRDLDGLGALLASALRRGLGAPSCAVALATDDAAPRLLGVASGERAGGDLAAAWAALAESERGVAYLAPPAPRDGEAAQHGARLAVRLGRESELLVFAVLDPREDGRLYTREDHRWLETLAARAAIAFENAHTWERLGALQRRLAEENRALRQEVSLQHEFEEFVGRSEPVREALSRVQQVADTDVPVLVVGETGTGKELVANALHALSKRRAQPLVKLSCAAVPESLFESELFGHEKGAFTGAATSRAGRFESADGGTLLLDDVDTLPLAVQAKLLRALQEGEVQRLGEGRVRRVDVRIVAATNRDLLGEVRAGRFREDLYYRLDVVSIRLPALRERGDDLVLLAEHFAARTTEELGRPARPLSAAALRTIRRHDWPGNVRELRNAIERAVVMSAGGEIEMAEPETPRDPAGASAVVARDEARPLAESLRQLKIAHIQAALAHSGGSQKEAAALLGLHAQSLNRMLKELGLRGS